LGMVNNPMLPLEERTRAQTRMDEMEQGLLGGKRPAAEETLNPGERFAINKNGKRVLVDKNGVIVRESK